MSENYDVIAIFPIYGQFGAMQKSDSERIVTFYLTKSESKAIKSLIQLSHYCSE